MARYGMCTEVAGTMEEVKPKVLEALKSQGFGVLTEINVQKTMKEKIGAEYEPYFILGACNPQLANQALSADRAIGLLLPCNVVLRQAGGKVEVSILDPEVMFSVAEEGTRNTLTTLPQEAKRKLMAAIEMLEKPN